MNKVLELTFQSNNIKRRKKWIYDEIKTFLKETYFYGACQFYNRLTSKTFYNIFTRFYYQLKCSFQSSSIYRRIWHLQHQATMIFSPFTNILPKFIDWFTLMLKCRIILFLILCWTRALFSLNMRINFI